METARDELNQRLSPGRTVPGTRRCHFFAPISKHEIAYKRTSEDEEFTETFCITGEEDEMPTCNAKIYDYVSCKYDDKWWICLVEDIHNVSKIAKLTLCIPLVQHETSIGQHELTFTLLRFQLGYHMYHWYTKNANWMNIQHFRR